MKKEQILLDHGSGGRASHKLISELILRYFENPILSELDDSAVFTIGNQQIAFSTDSYTVDPIFFPGGDIGELAINGTVNDIAMRGAKPLYISVGFIIEEGFPRSDLEKILNSMKKAANEADVLVVTGDTKVVNKKAADKIFINTSGVGIIPDGVHISGKSARSGDKIIVSGTIADHGVTILTQREGLKFESGFKSDTAPLNHMTQAMMAVSNHIHTLRDPTRGGLGTSLNEIAQQSNVGIVLYENEIPIRDDVSGACELLGLDPLYIANEGKLLVCVQAADTEKVLNTMRQQKYGKDSCIIGEVTKDNLGKVLLKTAIGGTRIVDMLTGEQLPRIC